METLKFIYQNWNRSYYELQPEETTCSYYRNLYKGRVFKMPLKLRIEKTKDITTWAKYAYEQNQEFMNQMWLGKFSLKTPELFDEKSSEIARMFQITALLENTNQPYAYAEIVGMFFTVCFIDEYNRVYMQYSFQNDDSTYQSKFIQQRFKERNLFLVEIEMFIYPDRIGENGWENKDYISYAFTPEGHLEITKIFDVQGEGLIEKYVAPNPVNVESNWEPYPNFGEWDSIFRIKRWGELELAQHISQMERI